MNQQINIEVIDQRFNRQEYDAEQALVEFAAVARDQADISLLETHLGSTVQDTLQPETISLWLKLSQLIKKITFPGAGVEGGS